MVLLQIFVADLNTQMTLILQNSSSGHKTLSNSVKSSEAWPNHFTHILVIFHLIQISKSWAQTFVRRSKLDKLYTIICMCVIIKHLHIARHIMFFLTVKKNELLPVNSVQPGMVLSTWIKIGRVQYTAI